MGEIEKELATLENTLRDLHLRADNLASFTLMQKVRDSLFVFESLIGDTKVLTQTVEKEVSQRQLVIERLADKVAKYKDDLPSEINTFFKKNITKFLA